MLSQDIVWRPVYFEKCVAAGMHTPGPGDLALVFALQKVCALKSCNPLVDVALNAGRRCET